MSLVGKKAPLFTAEAVVDGNRIVSDFKLEQFIGHKHVLVFFYPLDFTFVCPTEIVAFQEQLEEFEKRNTQLIGISVDSIFSHWNWVNTPLNKGGIAGTTFPLVSDLSKVISINYGVLAGRWEFQESLGGESFLGQPVAFRGWFLIDKGGYVRHETVNDLPLGRSVAEALRMVDVLQHFEQHGEVCPADWHKGESAIKATPQGVADYLSKKSVANLMKKKQ